jgi:hypothetical protein
VIGGGPGATPGSNPVAALLAKERRRREFAAGALGGWASLSKIGGGHAYNRYAIDVGVALLVLHNEAEQRGKRGVVVDADLLDVARAAAAQGALSILPHFDALAQEAGIEV